MNIQPLEIYGDDASFGGGLKLLNRYYDDALITVVRHNDGVSAEVYPDSFGKVSLYSQIAVGSLFSSATTLGSFLNYDGFTPDTQVLGQSITAGVSKIYDQSPNQNNAVNANTSTQFLIADAGEVFFGEYGLELYTLDRFMTIGSVSQAFSLHLTYTPIAETQSAPQAVIKQADDAFAFNSRNALVSVIGGSPYVEYSISTVTNQEGSALVLIDEDYFSNYTGAGIVLESSTAKILTIESKSTDAAYDDTQDYKLGGANGAFYTCIVYTGNGFKTRRHRTNLIMSEDIENLALQLGRFSPESYYNHFYNAAAIFATVSLAGTNNFEQKKLIRILRDTISGSSSFGITPSRSTWAAWADVYADSSGRISLSSPIGNVTDYLNRTITPDSTILGDFLNADGYSNPDNLPVQPWAFVDIWYDQSLNEKQAIRVPYRYPIIYNGEEQRFEPAVGDTSIVKAMNFDYGGIFQSYFNLENDSILAPKSIIFVYANNGITPKYSLLGGWGSGGPGYYSRIPRISGGLLTVKGFSVEEGIAVTSPYGDQFTDYGLDTKTHIAGISFGTNPQFIVDDNAPVEFDIYTNNPLFDPLEFNVIGPMYGYIQAVIIYEEDRLSDFPEIFSTLQAFFGVEDSIFPETSVFEDIPHLYGDVTNIYSMQELYDLALTLVTLKVDSTNKQIYANAGVISDEVYDGDVQALAGTNDARLLTIYNQINRADDIFTANEGATLIKLYTGTTQQMVRGTSPGKIIVKPTTLGQRFTTTGSISIPDDSCIYIIGEFPSTDCTILGNGTTSIRVSGSSFAVTTSADTYGFPSGRSANDFFIFRIDRSGTSLYAQTNKDTIYEYEITTAETLEFNTLLTNGASDSTVFTGGLYGVVVFNKSKRLVGQDITTTLYGEYGLTAPADASETPSVLGSYPTIQTTTLLEGYNNTDTSFTETITNPSGLAVGDLLLVGVVSDAGSSGPLEFSPPTGWSYVGRAANSGDCALEVIYRVVDGTEGSTSDIPLYRNSTFNPVLYYNIWAARISGAATSSTINVVGSDAYIDGSSTLSIPGVTTTVDNTLLLAFAVHDGSDGDPLSADVGWTEVAVLDNPDVSSTSGMAGLIVSKEFGTAGATGNLTITSSNSDGLAGIMFAIAPQS